MFILTDDLSWNLVNEQFAPHIMQLERRGETFDHYFVADSLCCPSRSTIFTGLYPTTRTWRRTCRPTAGTRSSNPSISRTYVRRRLQTDGYSTSMLGKYLNGYGDPWGKTGTKVKVTRRTVPHPATPTSRSRRAGRTGTSRTERATREFNYWQNDNGTWNFYKGKQNYGVDVINSEAQSFIKQHATSPFMIEAATFAPHKPYTPAPRNANDFPRLTEPRDPSFNAPNTNPPAWLGHRRR